MKPRLLLGALLVVLGASWLIAGPAQLGGGATYVTTYGDSMEPAVHSGDLVLVRPAPDYAVGDAVAYRSDDLDVVVLHRIIAIEDGRYTLQGDNNSWLDPERPTQDEVIGKQWLHIPGGGTWLRRLTSPSLLAVAAFLLVISGGAATHVQRRRKKDRRLMAQHSVSARHAFTSLPSALRTAALGIAALGLTGATLAAVAWTRPAETIAASDEAVTSTVEFSYSTHVPPSAAYDGTTVTDPQPIFRRLADTVDVSFSYHGRPGTVTVDAELSTPGGWRSTVRLADPVEFDDERHEGAVELDLTSIQSRADAAAAVTGLPATSVNIAVVPRVSIDGGGQIAPRLELTLDAHALRLGGDNALTVEDSTSVAGTGREPTTLSALGHSLDVMAARKLSLAAVALAAVLGVALGIAVPLAGPVAESERIRRKYGQLILPVLPVAVPPGRPIIDVPDLESLAKLAERYGLMVLHWSRSDVDTYVVQDEGTTYRYRIGSRDHGGEGTSIQEQAHARHE